MADNDNELFNEGEERDESLSDDLFDEEEVEEEEISDEDVSSVFWVGLIISAVLYFIIFAANACLILILFIKNHLILFSRGHRLNVL